MEINEIKEIKEKLPTSPYQIISSRLKGKYTTGTIRQMFNGWRTMNPAVIQEAKELINFVNNDSQESTNQ